MNKINLKAERKRKAAQNKAKSKGGINSANLKR
jgi:hypothetical protein